MAGISVVKPQDIERTSMEIIQAELDARGVSRTPEEMVVLKRVIHTTADFDYVDNLAISPGAIPAIVQALQQGTPFVTDTTMAQSGINKAALERLGGSVHCFMSDPEVARAAKNEGVTRATISMRKASVEFPHAVFAVGNAPTALIELSALLEDGLRPTAVIGVPVGFVNVVESKELTAHVCSEYGIPHIIAFGRKGGSNVAAAICNALLYLATDQVDPSRR